MRHLPNVLTISRILLTPVLLMLLMSDTRWGVFWAFVIFIASYIPIIGGVLGVGAPPVFALLQFQSYWPAVMLLGGL